MDDDRDNTIRAAMILVASIVIAIVASVIGFGAYQSGRKPVAAVNTVVSGEAPAPIGEALAKIYFEVGKSDLLPEAGGALKTVVDAALAAPAKIVLISGFHDPSGDPVKNAELAKNRALAARDALVAGGLSVDRIKLRKPEATTGDGDAQEQRRVEFRVQ